MIIYQAGKWQVERVAEREPTCVRYYVDNIKTGLNAHSTSNRTEAIEVCDRLHSQDLEIVDET
jgi:hypothetical protein